MSFHDELLQKKASERWRKNEAEIVIAADEYEKVRRWEISESIFLVNDMEMIQ